MALTLDKLIATLNECGCCPPPGCCPPVVECRSLTAEAASVGWINPGSDSDSLEFPSRQTRYLRKVRQLSGIPIAPFMSAHPDGTSGLYESTVWTVTWAERQIEEYSQGFAVLGCGEMTAIPEYTYRCEYIGGWTRRDYGYYYNGSAWISYLGSEEVGVIDDAAGEETEEHAEWVTEAAAWDAAHPDYPAELAAYEADHAAWQAASDAWQAGYDAWVIEYNEWDAGGQIGDAPPEIPPFDEEEPTSPSARPEEPEEFYPPCTKRTTVTTDGWNIEGGEVVHAEGFPVVTKSYPGFYPSLSVPQETSSDPDPSEELFESPVTYEAWLALVDAWVSSHANFDEVSNSDSTACIPGDSCIARKQIGSGVDPWQSSMEVTYFQYRFKLNKCCAYIDIRSEWDTIFYPQAWLDWKAAADVNASDDDPTEPSRPVKNPRAWTWTGIPPRCPESSSSSSDSAVLDPYDYEPMWSPWSATIMVPAGQYEGIVTNRNYQQKCYEAPPQEFPDLFGTYDDSSES